MLGDEKALKYARRDLVTLARAASLAPRLRSVVQAGGSLGVFAQWLASRFRAVYCFEPDPRIFRMMVRNLVHDEKVVMMQAALGCERRFVATSRSRRRKVETLPHDGVTHVSGPGILPTLRVDDLGLEDLDLLVLDLEGYEHNALRGAEATIEECRPVVMIEVCENCRFEGVVEEDIRTWLRIRGYELVFRAHSDEVYRHAG